MLTKREIVLLGTAIRFSIEQLDQNKEFPSLEIRELFNKLMSLYETTPDDPVTENNMSDDVQSERERLAKQLVAIWMEHHDLALQEIERLQDALRKIAYAPPGYGHGPTLSESIQIARKALGE